METLLDRATFIRQSLQKSQSITDSMVTILGSFDHRLSALDSAMRPTQARTHSIRRAHENIEKTLKSAEVILKQFDLLHEADAKILRGPHEDLESYLEAVDQLQSSVRFFSSNKSFKSSDGVINHANGLFAKAILKLEEEFRQLLNSYSKPVERDCLFDGLPDNLRQAAGSSGQQGGDRNTHQGLSPENGVYTPPTLIPPRIMPLLHDLAVQMVQAGHQQQCLKIYRDIRAPVLEQSLRKLGVERLSKEDVQRMQWEDLEAKIGSWIHYMRIAVKLLFKAERIVCDRIFDAIDFRDLCFAEVSSSSIAVLLSFGEAIVKSKRSPEKLFVLLDMYEIMHDLQPEIESIFAGKPCAEMRENAFNLAKRLAQTAHETLGEFEDAVEKDATRTAVLDGTVHPLTSYVINYVKFLFDYQSTLRQLFQDTNGEGDDSNTQLTNMTMRIMQALQTNLDGKSKQYKDLALTHLFLMNNIHYIVRSVRRSEAKDVLGDDWVQRHRRIVQQHANQYKRVAWGKILPTLSVVSSGSSGGSGTVGDSGSSGISRAMVKDRFKNFNMQFEELHQRQSQWTVPDSELRESLRLAIAEVLLPAYRSFIKRFGVMVETGKNPQKYMRYTPEDIERMLGEFFEGKTWNDPKR